MTALLLTVHKRLFVNDKDEEKDIDVIAVTEDKERTFLLVFILNNITSPFENANATISTTGLCSIAVIVACFGKTSSVLQFYISF